MGAVFALFAAYYYWSPKILGKTYNELLGHIHFYTMFIGVNKTKKNYLNNINYLTYFRKKLIIKLFIYKN